MYRFISSNIRKTYFYIFLVFVLVVGIGYAFAWYYGDYSLLVQAVVFALIYNLIAYFYSDKIVLSLAKAHLVDKKEEAELYRLVENLSIRSGLPMPKIYVIEDNSPNAFATGRDPQHSAVAVTRGLINLLDREELRAVLAHEMSHIKNYDIRLQTIIAVLVGAIVILADYLRRWFWFSNRERREEGFIGLLVMLFLLVVAPLAARLIQLAISRKREFLADASAAELTRYPQGLISALEKISSYPQGVRSASLATAHLYFASPFRENKNKSNWFESLFLTHPPIEERIEALKSFGF
ncbi:M48 family metalloprotease [bacterium]|nr:M48 family metalloprotease [bacterium]